jgi:hypothetical protein
MTAGGIEKVAVPEGRRGPWSVERFALHDMPRTGAFGRGAAASGTYTKLLQFCVLEPVNATAAPAANMPNTLR